MLLTEISKKLFFMNKKNILFVCSQNKWRSPTAERIFRRDPFCNVYSCGTSRNAKRTINYKDLVWADVIFVMERKHKSIILDKFPKCKKPILVLDIEDDYCYMDQMLIDRLLGCLEPYDIFDITI